MAIDLQNVDFGPPAVPAFLTKLRLLVDDEDTNDLIYWDPSGASFHICDGNRLAKEILPLFFKHNNLSSFIRQLNMCKRPYIVILFSDGFRKVNRVDPSIVLKADTEDMEFRHPFFVRHRQHLMSKIQRKPPNHSYSSNFFNGRLFNNIGVGPFLNSTQSPLNQTASPGLGQRPVNSGDFMRLSGVVRTLRLNQEAMAQQMSLVQSENQLLYGELHELRERLEQQSQLIQTLFSFLSAFAKDRRAQNFRFPLKRKALPFTSSNVLPTNSRSGLKLNLPQGYRLDDATAVFQPLNISPSDDLDDTPYKLAKMDRPTTQSNQLVALTDAAASPFLTSTDCLTASPDQLEYPAASLTPTNPAKGDNQLRSTGKRVFATLHALTSDHSALPTPPGNNSPSERRSPGTMSHVIVCSQAQMEKLYSRKDVKPIASERDLTMASLTQASGSSPASAIIPSTLELPNVDHLTGSDTQLVDLNLSRCTTPVSLIQPDSVDICEFLANRDENESEISIDDLFLASGALDDPNFKMNEKVSVPSSSADARDTPRSGRDSVDTDATDALHGDNFDHDLPSAPDLIASANTPSSDSLKNALMDLESWPVGVTKAASVVLPESSTKTKSKTSSVSHSTRRTSLIRESTPAPEPVSVSENDDLFGLPWEDQDLLLDCPTSQNGVGSADGAVNDFNAGLLPIQKRATSRIQIIPQPDPSTFSPPHKRDSSSDHSLILGETNMIMHLFCSRLCN
ncbi:hypothetical protein PHET_09880 [Paragonimus heterotremus]|uniref:HSF-type DNA-binding domain-containing protein n=1 Tax=Paragonimus heterotremus TaxID=100268 RepID=A0A8J4SGX4_9TREM|nr:hypothetical protein PHET_09880 [Paragonimus heterotremus]